MPMHWPPADATVPLPGTGGVGNGSLRPRACRNSRRHHDRAAHMEARKCRRIASLSVRICRSSGGPQTTPAAAPEAYRIEFDLYRDGKPIGAPSMTVLACRPARFTLAALGGAVDIQVAARPDAKTAAGVATVKLDTRVLERTADTWVLTGEQSMRVAEGKTASMEVAGARGCLRISMKATRHADANRALSRPGPCDEPEARVGVSNI